MAISEWKKNPQKFDDLVRSFHKNHVYESNWIFWLAKWQKLTPKKTLVWTWKESLWSIDTYSLFSYYLCTYCTLTALSELTYLVVHICWTFVCSNLQSQKMPFNTQLQQHFTSFLSPFEIRYKPKPIIVLYLRTRVFITQRRWTAKGSLGNNKPPFFFTTHRCSCMHNLSC